MEKKLSINHQIKELLENGEKVVSFIPGKIGVVTGYLDGIQWPVKVKSPRIINSEGVTTFDSGDECVIIEENGVHKIVSPEYYEILRRESGILDEKEDGKNGS